VIEDRKLFKKTLFFKQLNRRGIINMYDIINTCDIINIDNSGSIGRLVSDNRKFFVKRVTILPKS